MDGLCETVLTVLNEMGTYPAMIKMETERYLPFLATTRILMLAAQAGVGRETAHEAIRKHAVSEALRLRNTGATDNRLAELIAGDPAFRSAGISRDDLCAVLSDVNQFIGRAREQLDSVCSQANALIQRHAEQAAYEPLGIL
jgi:adenylosuccinate lyase